MSDTALLCGACGLTWESRAAAVEIWKRGRCLACGSAMKRRAEATDSRHDRAPTAPQSLPQRRREPAAAPVART